MRKSQSSAPNQQQPDAVYFTVEKDFSVNWNALGNWKREGFNGTVWDFLQNIANVSTWYRYAAIYPFEEVKSLLTLAELFRILSLSLAYFEKLDVCHHGQAFNLTWHIFSKYQCPMSMIIVIPFAQFCGHSMMRGSSMVLFLVIMISVMAKTIQSTPTPAEPVNRLDPVRVELLGKDLEDSGRNPSWILDFYGNNAYLGAEDKQVFNKWIKKPLGKAVVGLKIDCKGYHNEGIYLLQGDYTNSKIPVSKTAVIVKVMDKVFEHCSVQGCDSAISTSVAVCQQYGNNVTKALSYLLHEG
ncbi:hypothetical protein F5877DRAFT_71013 [Lentinula edodes]|nr:hypothetical protein F5877DRAFT_71013 [Lentinula edodes]